MRPRIDTTNFGSITIEGNKYPFDVYISRAGQISKRKKKLSKKIYGTSHKISEDEIKHLLKDKVEALLIGTGQNGRVQLSDSAAVLLSSRAIQVQLQPTPQAVKTWNQTQSALTGLFHVTC